MMFPSMASAAACAMVVAGSVTSSPQEAQALQKIDRYCAASWRQAQVAPQDWADCTQEVFADLLNRVSREGLTEAMEEAQSAERRELNRCIWATAQRWRRARRCHVLGDADVADRQTARRERVRQIHSMLAEEFSALPELQRQILEQTVEGASVAEIAAELELPAPKVSDEKYKAIQRLRAKHA